MKFDDFPQEFVLTAQLRSTIPGPRASFLSHRLMWGILEDLARTLERARRTNRHDAVVREARRWLDNDDRAWPFSFLRVCEALDLPPNTVRRRLRAGASERRGAGAILAAVSSANRHGPADAESTEARWPAHARG